MKIALYKGTGLIEKAILWFCRGGYSHAAIVLNDGSIVEAYPFKGVRHRKCIEDQMKKCIVDVYEIPTTLEQDEIIENFLSLQIGKKYDWIAILGFVLHKTKTGRKQYAKWICSELVFATLRKANVLLLERIEAWEVSPTLLSYNTMMCLKRTCKI